MEHVLKAKKNKRVEKQSEFCYKGANI